MKSRTFIKVLNILEKEFPSWNAPVVSLMAKRGERTPFQILVSTIISLRTKDQITAEVSERLFKKAKTPEEILELSEKELAELLFPSGFYNNKAKTIKKISEILINDYNGNVPDSLDDLLKLPGVGRKTANLVISLAYKKPAICVDVHVHRISNRLGIVCTNSPEETENELMKRVPKKYWNKINDLLVSFGQTLCKPISPYCNKCPVMKYCSKNGVTSYR